MKDKLEIIKRYFENNPEEVCRNTPERNNKHYTLLKSAHKIIKKQEKQLSRLDDVEGLVQIIHEKGNCCQTLNESKGIASAVINYIKGE